jgi:hypothetical protein
VSEDLLGCPVVEVEGPAPEGLTLGDLAGYDRAWWVAMAAELYERREYLAAELGEASAVVGATDRLLALIGEKIDGFDRGGIS